MAVLRYAAAWNLRRSGRPMRVGQSGHRSIDEVAAATVALVDDSLGVEATSEALKFAHPEFEHFECDVEQLMLESGRTGPLPRHAQPYFLSNVIIREGEAVRTRLLVKNPALFSKVDRLRSEADLRSALALPLMGLGLAIAERSHYKSVSGSVLAAMIVASIGLSLDSRYKRQASNDALAEAMAIGEVEAPTVSRLRALAKEDDEKGRFVHWQDRRKQETDSADEGDSLDSAEPSRTPSA